MPQHARVVIVEDDGDWVQTYTRALTDAGHEIVGVAHSLDEARTLVAQLPGLNVQVAIVDGNLGNGHEEGDRVVERIRQLKLDPRIQVIRVAAGVPKLVSIYLDKAGDGTGFQARVLAAIVTALRI